MRTFYLDTYQSKVIEAFQRMDPIVVIGQKMSGRSFLLSEIGRRQVLDNKHVLMVVSDVQNALIVQKKLTRFLPSEQALVLDPVELLPGQ
ncbi:MAG TPA: hypothetical protein DCQ58_09915, partial [Saprospirales bacterium]|nr:hypothetical protein [Saprospirales bacterium]